jgi:hypothetical protein
MTNLRIARLDLPKNAVMQWRARDIYAGESLNGGACHESVGHVEALDKWGRQEETLSLDLSRLSIITSSYHRPLPASEIPSLSSTGSLVQLPETSQFRWSNPKREEAEGKNCKF